MTTCPRCDRSLGLERDRCIILHCAWCGRDYYPGREPLEQLLDQDGNQIRYGYELRRMAKPPSPADNPAREWMRRHGHLARYFDTDMPTNRIHSLTGISHRYIRQLRAEWREYRDVVY